MTTLPTSIPSRAAVTHDNAANESTLWREARDYLRDVLDARARRVHVPAASVGQGDWQLDFTRDVLPDLEFGRD